MCRTKIQLKKLSFVGRITDIDYGVGTREFKRYIIVQFPKRINYSNNTVEHHKWSSTKDTIRLMYFKALDTICGEINNRSKQEVFEVYNNLKNLILKSVSDGQIIRNCWVKIVVSKCRFYIMKLLY